MNKLILLIVAAFLFNSCAATKTAEPKVKIVTNYGNITLKLYEVTPEHTANFLKLVENKFYDGQLFHRVIRDFMIQAGDPNSVDAAPGIQLGSGGPDYTIKAEFNDTLIHKRGALAAARQGDNINPEKRSSGSQFYIVQGKTYTDEELTQLETQMQQGLFLEIARKLYKIEKNKSDSAGLKLSHEELAATAQADAFEIYAKEKPFKFTQQQRNIYKTIGGTPHLDGGYTVFGEVVEGFDVLKKISEVETDSNGRPKTNVVIEKIKIL